MVDFKPVESSNIEAVGYEPGHRDKGVLHVRFKGGARYAYKGVPAQAHADLMESKSPGSHLYNNIIDRFSGRKVNDEDDGA